MKIVVFADIHGRATWKTILSREAGADKYVFLGDYFDNHTISANNQCLNFLDIIAFKRTHPENVELLIGNHDFPYIMHKDYGWSGYQKQGSKLIEPLFDDHKQYLRVAYKHNNILFTHAGVSEVWLRDIFGKNYINDSDHTHLLKTKENVDGIDTDLNKLLFKIPKVFDFEGFDPYGDSPTQGPLWIRPGSLIRSSKILRTKCDLIQVVGHTAAKSIQAQLDRTNGKYIFADAVHETSGEYLVIEGNKFIAKSINR